MSRHEHHPDGVPPLSGGPARRLRLRALSASPPTVADAERSAHDDERDGDE